MAGVHDTPAMRQYHRFKEQHPECLLLFRMGDFYELFYDDAEKAHSVLGITLTRRTEGIPMAGVPYHSVESYLRRLIAAGYRVALCDQIEDASQAKGVVQRDVTRLVTPGTLTDEAMLDEATENPIAAVQFLDEQRVALAFAELSTGSLQVATLAATDLADELARIDPHELLYVETADGQAPPRVVEATQTLGCSLTGRPAWQFRLEEAAETLRRQYQVATLKGFDLAEDEPVVGPAGALVRYLIETQQADEGRLPHLQAPSRYEQAEHLVVDQVSLRSLEIERTLRSGEVRGSLLGALQDCRTAMGKRTLRRWLCYPLADRGQIEKRQEAVEALVETPRLADDLQRTLDGIQDVQRIASRIAVGRPNPRDLVALGKSLSDLQGLAQLLEAHPALADHRQRLSQVSATLSDLGRELQSACIDDPPSHLREGGLIRDGYDAELDEQRSLQNDTGSFLADYQKKLIDETGIPTLKIGYNRVFGYYIEVTHAHADKAPTEFTRKQTLKNAERYITPQLKEFEDKVLGASQKAIAREQTLFQQLCKRAAEHLAELHEYAQVVAELDVLGCFARCAVRFGYIRPRIVDEPVLRIHEGRHPVLDQMLAERFVPNDVELRGEGTEASGTKARRETTEASEGTEGPGDRETGPLERETRNARRETASLALITGPNMAGKSTYIRQAALLTLLAHTGSFIPAAEATVGLTDRIFTRIGASDELHMGQSTFMVEMTETANICHHAGERSLVILDEIGRGTSTLDGLALAWAIAEHLAERGCRTLFATHYHELTELGERWPNVANLNVTVREWKDQVVFLHQITPGAADKSYGIHVAKIAGLPPNVVQRARDVMDQLQLHTSVSPSGTPAEGAPADNGDPHQMGLFTEYVEHPAVDRLRQSDLHEMSPLDAFDLLRRLKQELEET